MLKAHPSARLFCHESGLSWPLRRSLCSTGDRRETCSPSIIRGKLLHASGLGSHDSSSSLGLWWLAASSSRMAPKLMPHPPSAVGNDHNGNGVEGWDPSLEIEVPADQRPANELAALKEEALYSWAELKPVDFGLRLGGLWVLFFVFLGGPIASASFEPTREPLRFVLAGGAGALFAVAVIILRLYLGWSYVGNRLLSAVVPYEETGWYDGQLWVKPPEVLARDRLLGAYQVKPVMNRLKQTLLGAAALLVTATVSLFLLVPPDKDETVAAFTPSLSTGGALAAESKTDFRLHFHPNTVHPTWKEDLLNLPMKVMVDDDLAAAAAAAANGRPVYCTDRFYRALAGGQYCKWEDLRK